MKNILFLFLVFTVLVGCAQKSFVNVEEEGEFDRFEFRSTLSRKETATVRDLVILVSQSYKEQRDLHKPLEWYQAFIDLGWIDAGLDLDQSCTRGQVGRLVAGRLDLQGNIFLFCCGPTERYGFREIIRLKFLKKGFPNEYLSGSTLMNVQSRSTTWVKKIPGRLEDYKTHTAAVFTEAFK